MYAHTFYREDIFISSEETYETRETEVFITFSEESEILAIVVTIYLADLLDSTGIIPSRNPGIPRSDTLYIFWSKILFLPEIGEDLFVSTFSLDRFLESILPVYCMVWMKVNSSEISPLSSQFRDLYIMIGLGKAPRKYMGRISK